MVALLIGWPVRHQSETVYQDVNVSVQRILPDIGMHRSTVFPQRIPSADFYACCRLTPTFGSDPTFCSVL